VHKLDPSDRKILSMIQSDIKTPLETVASETGLSAATVQRRIKRMRDDGIILKEVAVLDPSALGWSMTFLVMVEMERERIYMLDAFKRKLKNETQVQQCYYITGDADFALICMASSMEDYEKLTRRLFFDDENVRRFRTSVVMDRTKVNLDVGL